MVLQSFLQIPGPTNIPARIQKAMLRPLINHRGDEFQTLLHSCVASLKELLHTGNDLVMFPSSGSGGLESTIVNLLNKEDKILTSSIGIFGERVAQIAVEYGLNPVRIEKEWGFPVTPEDIEHFLKADIYQDIKIVYVPHTETTTGVANDIKGIAKVIKDLRHPALFAVDSVSAFACMPLKMDEWGIDVVITASQKGLMLPPGLSIVALSERAWGRCSKGSNLPKWYWDYNQARKKLKESFFPYTPPTMLLFGLKEALAMLIEEGIENVWLRHHQNACIVRDGIKALGLDLFAQAGSYSDTVTAVKLPEGIKWEVFSKKLSSKYNVVVGGGLGQLSEKIFRVGHMGELDLINIFSILGAIQMSLIDCGFASSTSLANFITNFSVR